MNYITLRLSTTPTAARAWAAATVPSLTGDSTPERIVRVLESNGGDVVAAALAGVASGSPNDLGVYVEIRPGRPARLIWQDTTGEYAKLSRTPDGWEVRVEGGEVLLRVAIVTAWRWRHPSEEGAILRAATSRGWSRRELEDWNLREDGLPEVEARDTIKRLLRGCGLQPVQAGPYVAAPATEEAAREAMRTLDPHGFQVWWGDGRLVVDPMECEDPGPLLPGDEHLSLQGRRAALVDTLGVQGATLAFLRHRQVAA